MNFQIIDTKLKNLIQVCKESENYKKLAVVSFILTSNILNEIGIKLGIRPRNSSSGEKIFEYLELINKVFEDNLKIPIFQKEHVETLRVCEILFLKNKGDIPYEYIKTMFDNKICACLKFTQRVRALRGGLQGCGGTWSGKSKCPKIAFRFR